MREVIKMLVVLTMVSAVSGLALGFMNKITLDPIAQAEFKFAKEPALKEVLPEYDNDLVKDQFTIKEKDGTDVVVYPAKQGGKIVAVAFESSAKGFGGDVWIMVGIDLEKDILRGIGIVKQSETPGMGARMVEEPFKAQFKKDFPVSSVFAVKADGGKIDALSGATISSRAVCGAINDAFKFYQDNSTQIKNPQAK